MSKSVSSFWGGLLLGLLVATVCFSLILRPDSSNGVADRQLVLKMGHGLDTSHPIHQAMVFMQKRLVELSRQQVTIHLYPSAVLGNENQCIEQLQNGSLAMTKVSAASIENFVPVMEVFNLPYIFKDEQHYWNVLNGSIGERLLQAGESKFLKGLCYFDAGSRNFYSIKKPIRTPDDLKGMKIRVMNSPTAIGMVKAMGGAPTPISWGELYSALAQGTVDGAENNPPSFTTNKHYEVCKYFTLDGHSRVPDMLIISTKVWDGLSPEVQGWVHQAAQEASKYQRKLWEQATQAALKRAREEGVTVYEVDTALFAEKVQPMLNSIENLEVKAALDEIREVASEN